MKQLEHKKPELARLEALEKIVATVEGPMRKGLAALGEILNEKLWKAAGWESEKQYLENRWGGDVGNRLFFHKKKMAKVAAAIGGDSLPNGVRESWLACLVNFEPEMQREILERAEKTAPGGKMTAAWIEQVADKVRKERLAAIKAQAEEERVRAAQAAAKAATETTANDEEKDDEEVEETDEEADSPAPDPIKDAMADPIIDNDRVVKLERQAERTVRKLERIALGLNCTPEYLLERFGSR